ncbi:MAG: 50S ribosomal protein L7Ae-like protein [Candidatus Syntrophonatronum acetioxidans]|uniref:50S ribosomal protein L7Ae-like protein n=1 Tax=Candidatus Syntrophonatronum acetioxidans TaxID=1795816 RepID=A0A424YH51_9FIRM|nr:MAG: 50S ribosomal protein L7Ae-like protein [Candidatus Syntrophonatronum acetioxidans]
MSLERLQGASKIAIGTKQTTKLVRNNKARTVFIAQDAEERITRPVVGLCNEQNIELIEVPHMAELGKACGIKVGAAMAAIVEE